jgi:hypothetical protein
MHVFFCNGIETPGYDNRVTDPAGFRQKIVMRLRHSLRGKQE